LGWLAVGLELAQLKGEPNIEAEHEVKELAELVLEHYAPSLVPRSDEQAPFVMTFVEVARRRGWTDVADQVIGCYLNG
jgi:hypothetical protein